MSGVLILAILLRVIYLWKTPYSLRAHDFDAHLDYVRYLLEHWAMPAASAGWEFYQPPLAYAIYAIWQSIYPFLERTDSEFTSVLQLLSFLLSVALVPLSFWIGKILFPKGQLERFLLSLLIAVFPSLLYVTSRISNDPLAQVVSFVSIGLLFHWWRTESLYAWYAAALTIALGLLIKFTMLLFVPVMVVLFVWRSNKHMWKQGKHLLLALGLIALVAGWLPVVRSQEAEPRNMIPQHEGLDPGVLLPNTPANFFTFNPIQVVRIPYNDPWEDSARRQYFLEYFFRSAFLGEWNFGDELRWMSSFLVLLGLGLLVLSILGWVHIVRARDRMLLPLVVLSLALLAGAFTYRFINTCSCSQDIRYSTALMIPWCATIATGAGVLPRLGRYAAVGWILLFAATSIAFTFLLPWGR